MAEPLRFPNEKKKKIDGLNMYEVMKNQNIDSLYHLVQYLKVFNEWGWKFSIDGVNTVVNIKLSSLISVELLSPPQ